MTGETVLPGTTIQPVHFLCSHVEGSWNRGTRLPLAIIHFYMGFSLITIQLFENPLFKETPMDTSAPLLHQVAMPSAGTWWQRRTSTAQTLCGWFHGSKNTSDLLYITMRLVDGVCSWFLWNLFFSQLFFFASNMSYYQKSQRFTGENVNGTCHDHDNWVIAGDCLHNSCGFVDPGIGSQAVDEGSPYVYIYPSIHPSIYLSLYIYIYM